MYHLLIEQSFKRNLMGAPYTLGTVLRSSGIQKLTNINVQLFIVTFSEMCSQAIHFQNPHVTMPDLYMEEIKIIFII